MDMLAAQAMAAISQVYHRPHSAPVTHHRELHNLVWRSLTVTKSLLLTKKSCTAWYNAASLSLNHCHSPLGPAQPNTRDGQLARAAHYTHGAQETGSRG